MSASGQLTQVTDALQHSWQYAYTAGDLTSITDPLSNVWSQFVDQAGRAISSTDPLGRVTHSVFDKLNRVTSVVNPLGGETTVAYDANGNLTSLSDALLHTTSYTYDASDRVASRTDALSNATRYAYDLVDNLSQVTDRKSQVTSYTYDALDRLSEVTFDDSSTLTYTYDSGDRLIQIADSANGTISRQYDGFNRLLEETTPEGTVDYTYDADGRRASMTVAGQTPVTYDYDDAHRLTAIRPGTATAVLAYDAADRRTSLTYPNGIVTTYSYDGANRLVGVTYVLNATTLGDLTFLYDAAGNPVTVGGSWARTNLPPALVSATYDAANRISTWAAVSSTYDVNGNLTGDGTSTYTWNARNQLASISGATAASFAYDGIGRRRAKTVNSTTTQFLYDGASLVQDLSGGLPSANLFGGVGVDEVLTRTDVGGSQTLIAGALGSTLALADASGVVQTSYSYEPFGEATATGASTGNSLAFSGRESDGTGLMFYRARYYDPRRQRFVSEDPIGFAGGDVNLYGYVGNSPTRFSDPSGLIVFARSPVCNPSTGRRKDPWWGPAARRSLCGPPIIGLVPDLVPLGGGIPLPHMDWPRFPWPAPPSPPPGGPRPPGWDPSTWRYGYPEGPEPPAQPWQRLPTPRFFDPDGGEWHFHPQDPWHPDDHWNYNPWQHPYDTWRNVPLPPQAPRPGGG